MSFPSRGIFDQAERPCYPPAPACGQSQLSAQKTADVSDGILGLGHRIALKHMPKTIPNLQHRIHLLRPQPSIDILGIGKKNLIPGALYENGRTIGEIPANW